MTPVPVPVMTLATHDASLPLPQHETPGAAGLDLRACLAEGERGKGVILPPLGRLLVPTGLSISIPDGHEGQVRPRSGLAARHGITVLNSPGTIDSDYRGEVKVALINLGHENFTLNHGERIAQLVIAPYCRADLHRVDRIEETGRGAGGFGSTGVE